MSEPSFKICDLFSIEGNCPLGRIGTPADMAGIAIYLASPAAFYLNGVVIPVDGGFVSDNDCGQG